MLLSHHRKAIVKAILAGLECVDKGHEIAFTAEGQHQYGCICAATGLYFPEPMTKNQITCSEYGDFWMGLWLDSPLVIGEDGHTMFPRWLAEVLNEECAMGIEEEDVVN